MNHADGLWAVANALLRGKGTIKDRSEGMKWVRKAAYRNSAFAQCTLAFAYRDGDNVMEDPVRAVAWWILTQENGDEHAREEIPKLKSKMSAKQVEDASYFANLLREEIVRKASAQE